MSCMMRFLNIYICRNMFSAISSVTRKSALKLYSACVRDVLRECSLAEAAAATEMRGLHRHRSYIVKARMTSSLRRHRTVTAVIATRRCTDAATNHDAPTDTVFWLRVITNDRLSASVPSICVSLYAVVTSTTRRPFDGRSTACQLVIKNTVT